MADHFITEFGHRIDFVPGYYEANNFYAKFALKKWADRRAYENESVFETDAPIHNYMLARDWVLFSALAKFLERVGLLRRWRNGIDLGGAEGTVIRLFKAAGYVQHATNLDIVDFSKAAPEEHFAAFVSHIRDKSYFDQHTMNSIAWAKMHLDHRGDLIESFPHDQALDADLVMSAYDAPGQYDLVIANALMEFVDLDTILPKLKSILRKDGLFVGSFNAPWCPIVPCGILGDFPYAFQRLTVEDAQRYFTQYHPEQLTNLESRYNWFHEGKYRPTLSDWFALLQLYGLRIIAFERVSPVASERYKHTPLQLLREPWFNIFDVLRDAQHINDSVTMDDLMTTTYRVAITLR